MSAENVKKVVEMDEEQSIAFEMGTALAKYMSYMIRTQKRTAHDRTPDTMPSAISAEDFIAELGGKDEDVEIGRRIKAKRKELDLRQDDLVAKLKISQSELSKIENGEKCLSTSRGKKLAKILGVTFEWIFEGK
jgi:ribosome-binding protein aMBF1 (putative translation factor)